MTRWEEYKKKRLENLDAGAPVRPTDFLSMENHTTEEIAKTRMDICNECPRLVKLTKQCKECGCFMNLKTKLTHAKCPLGKW